MRPTVITRSLILALGGFWAFTALSGQATSLMIVVRALAEVERKVGEPGREVVKLVPAKRVVPGDEVIYTLEIRNPSGHDAVMPRVVRPVPAHMAYLADTATGPGAEVTFSVDGGRTFDLPENLSVVGVDGKLRLAKAIEYTHIRWQLKNTLKAKSVAFARFRAVVQ